MTSTFWDCSRRSPFCRRPFRNHDSRRLNSSALLLVCFVTLMLTDTSNTLGSELVALK